MTCQKLHDLGWEVLMQPPPSSNIASGDYHLFRLPQNSVMYLCKTGFIKGLRFILDQNGNKQLNKTVDVCHYCNNTILWLFDSKFSIKIFERLIFWVLTKFWLKLSAHWDITPTYIICQYDSFDWQLPWQFEDHFAIKKKVYMRCRWCLYDHNQFKKKMSLQLILME